MRKLKDRLGTLVNTETILTFPHIVVLAHKAPYLPVDLARGRVFLLFPLPLADALKEWGLVMIGRAVALALNEQRQKDAGTLGGLVLEPRLAGGGLANRRMMRGTQGKHYRDIFCVSVRRIIWCGSTSISTNLRRFPNPNPDRLGNFSRNEQCNEELV